MEGMVLSSREIFFFLLFMLGAPCIVVIINKFKKYGVKATIVLGL